MQSSRKKQEIRNIINILSILSAGTRKYGPAVKRRAVLAGNAHGNLLQIVTAPPMPGIVTAVKTGVSITSIKYQPQGKPQPHRPLAPSVTCGDSSLPEGAMGLYLFTLGFASRWFLLWNPSVAFGASSL